MLILKLYIVTVTKEAGLNSGSNNGHKVILPSACPGSTSGTGFLCTYSCSSSIYVYLLALASPHLLSSSSSRSSFPKGDFRSSVIEKKVLGYICNLVP